MVVVAWSEWARGPAVLDVRVSTNNGLAWGPIKRVPAPVGVEFPSVAVAGTTIHVAWSDSVALPHWGRVARSTDGGNSWTLRRLDARGTYGITKIAASGSAVFAVWVRYPDRALVGRFSGDGGLTWHYPEVLGSSTLGDLSDNFAIAARPDRLVVAWPGQGYPAVESPEVRVRIRAGDSWLPTVSVAAAPPTGQTRGENHAISASLLAGSRVGLAWAPTFFTEDGLFPLPTDVVWAESSDNGITWTPATVVSPAGTTYGAWAWPHVGSVSSIWSSRELRGVLINRFTPEPENNSRLFFSRGSGLP